MLTANHYPRSNPNPRHLPTASPSYNAPEGCFNFVSDAAGHRPPGSDDRTGVSSLGTFNKKIWFATAISWPLQFTWVADAKSALSEAVGLLLPFLILPTKLTHQRIHLHFDNMSLVWAWKKRHTTNVALMSIILRTLHILEAALPCKLHLPPSPSIYRSSKIADNLSQLSSTTDEDKNSDPPKPNLT